MNAPAELETCALCPRLCRHVCPVAVGSGRESATPTAMATAGWLWWRGDGTAGAAARAAALCTGCGACEEHCLHHRPLPALLSAVRDLLLPGPRPAAVAAPEGPGRLVAVEDDGRSWAEALSACLGRPVARLRTPDHLGAALLDHPDALARHAEAVARAVGDRVLVVADDACGAVARAAGLEVRHLAELAEPPADAVVHHPCRGPRLAGPTAPDALACCGAGAALPRERPEVAAEIAAEAVARLAAEARRRGGAPVASPDARCAAMLRRAGLDVRDPVDWLLAAADPAPEAR